MQPLGKKKERERKKIFWLSLIWEIFCNMGMEKIYKTNKEKLMAKLLFW